MIDSRQLRNRLQAWKNILTPVSKESNRLTDELNKKLIALDDNNSLPCGSVTYQRDPKRYIDQYIELCKLQDAIDLVNSNLETILECMNRLPAPPN